MLFNVMPPVSSSSNNLKDFSSSSFSSFSLFENRNDGMLLALVCAAKPHLRSGRGGAALHQAAELGLARCSAFKAAPARSRAARSTHTRAAGAGEALVGRRVYFLLTPAGELHCKKVSSRRARKLCLAKTGTQ